MEITAITKFKHGGLFQLLRKLGWNQSELARRADLRNGTVGDIINLKQRPTEVQANAIQCAFAAEGEFFDVLEEWPEGFRGFKQTLSTEQTREISPQEIVSLQDVMSEPAQIEFVDDRAEMVQAALAALDTKCRTAIELRILDNHTLQEVSKKMGYKSGERARQLVRDGIRTIRNRLETEDKMETMRIPNATARSKVIDSAH